MALRFSAQLPPIKINPDSLKALHSLAEKREITLAQAVRDAIRMYINAHQKGDL